MRKVSAKISQTVSKLYSSDKIMDKAMNGSHDGESFQDIAEKIFSNPDIIHETDKKTGITSMKMNDKMIGWYDKKRGIGNIDQSAYDQIKSMPTSSDPVMDSDTLDPVRPEISDTTLVNNQDAPHDMDEDTDDFDF